MAPMFTKSRINDARLSHAPKNSLWGTSTASCEYTAMLPVAFRISTRLVLRIVHIFAKGVKPVLISPAMPSESLLYDAHDPNCSVVLLITFGAGNVRDEGIIEAELTHIDCLWQLFKEGIPIVLGSPMMDGVVDSPYLSGARAVSRKEGDGNAISGGNVTGALLQIKCMVMLERAWDRATESVDYDKFRNLMEVDGGNDLI